MTPEPVRVLALAAVLLGLLSTPAGATTSAAPSCGATITGYAVLRADLVCGRAGLTLAPGATLDLGQHTLRMRARGVPAVSVIAREGEGQRAEIRNGTVSGGAGVIIRGTDDTEDDGRAQRLRLTQVTLGDSALRVTDAEASLVGSTLIDSAVRVRGGTLDVVRSTLTGVRTTGEPGASGRPNVWRVTNSSITGAWWTAGDTRVVDSRIIDTAPPRSTPADYRNVSVRGSRLTGPSVRVVASGTRLTIADSVVEDAGGFTAAGTVSLTDAIVRDSGRVTSDGATGRTEVLRSRFEGGQGVKGARVEVTNSAFTAIARPVSGRDVEVSDSRFVGNRGDTVTAYASLLATDNVFRDNRSTALRTRGGTLTGNEIRRQRGDGIRYHAGSTAAAPIRLGANRVLDGNGWGILVTQAPGLDLIADLGGNVAARNRHGQCSAPLVCSDG